MYQIANFTDNDDVKVIAQLGAFQVIEYQRDLSVTPDSAITAYYSAQMNVKKRQLVCRLDRSPVTIQAGSMQWMLGDVNATTGIKGVGDFLGKAVRGKATGESAIKPEYTGSGLLVLEPTINTSSCWTQPNGAAAWCWTTGCSWPANPACSTKP